MEETHDPHSCSKHQAFPETCFRVDFFALITLPVLGGAAFSPASAGALYGVTITPTPTQTATNTPVPTPVPATPVPGEAIEPEIGKSVQPGSALPGDQVSYSIIIQNDASKLNSVYLRDPLPEHLEFLEASATKGSVSFNESAGTVVVNIRVLQPFETVTLTVLGRVSELAPLGGSFCNTARITYDFKGSESTLHSNSACVSISDPASVSGIPTGGDQPALPAGSGTLPGAGDNPIQPLPADGDDPVHYMVKFVCGLQESGDGASPVVPGNYDTAVNIHNYTDAAVTLSFRPALSYTPGGTPPDTFARQTMEAAPFSVLDLDCETLWEITNLASGTFIEGMVDIGSPVLLPVVAVYTAGIRNQIDMADTGAGISIDVEYVAPFIPNLP